MALQVAGAEQCKPGAYWHAEPHSVRQDLTPSLLVAESIPEQRAGLCICLLLH